MKASRFFPTIFLAFILLIFSQTIIAQNWENFNPLHVNELELSPEQKTKFLDIEKDYSAAVQEMYKSPYEVKDSEEHYKNIKEQIKLLQIEKENAQKVILTAEQLTQFEGYIIEKKADRRGFALASQKKQIENNYLGLILTNEQNVSIYNKKKLLDQENIAWKKRGVRVKEIYQEVLTEKQFIIIVNTDKQKKEAREIKTLEEVKKGLSVAEEMMPLAEDFTLPKLLILRNKLETKISIEDKRTLADLRIAHRISFDEILNEGLEEIDNELEMVENPELNRYLEFTKDLIIDHSELISNAWGFTFFDEDENIKQLNTLLSKYEKDINMLEEELLFVIKETAKKGAVIASREYPLPPVALWINEIKLQYEMKLLFLLLDPSDDFSINIPSFESGEGQHIASTFPNPANKNQTLEFYTQQDGKVTIEIIDESGKVVKVISSENRMKGKQKLTINLQDLNSQIYFYRISSDEGISLIKFSVVK